MLNIAQMSPREVEAEEQYEEVLEMDFVEIREIDAGEKESLIQEKIQQEIQNLVSKMKAETGSTPSSSSNYLSEEARQRIEDNVRAQEQEFFDKANAQNDQEEYQDKYQFDPNNTDNNKNNDQSGQKVEGNVSVSYDVGNRNGMYLPKPTYRCESSGKVQVNIEVDDAGYVVKATIDHSNSTTSNECLLSESLKYAEKSKFNSSVDAPKKESGVIIYLFSSQ